MVYSGGQFHKPFNVQSLDSFVSCSMHIKRGYEYSEVDVQFSKSMKNSPIIIFWFCIYVPWSVKRHKNVLNLLWNLVYLCFLCIKVISRHTLPAIGTLLSELVPSSINLEYFILILDCKRAFVAYLSRNISRNLIFLVPIITEDRLHLLLIVRTHCQRISEFSCS